MGNETHLKWGLLLEEKKCSRRASSFLYELNFIEKGVKNESENGSVASPKVYLLTLNHPTHSV